MQLEKNDLFVVTRGYEYHTGSASFASILMGFGESWKSSPQDDKPRYDRSYNGIVFEALEVCGNLIAARVAFSRDKSWMPVGSAISLNLSEIEVMTVTRAYLEALAPEAVNATATANP